MQPRFALSLAAIRFPSVERDAQPSIFPTFLSPFLVFMVISCSFEVDNREGARLRGRCPTYIQKAEIRLFAISPQSTVMNDIITMTSGIKWHPTLEQQTASVFRLLPFKRWHNSYPRVGCGRNCLYLLPSSSSSLSFVASLSLVSLM